MRRTLTLALAVLALSAAPASAQTKLRYQFKEGQRLEYVMDQDMKMSMNVAGNDVEMKMRQQMGMKWNVVKVDQAGNATIKLNFTKVKMSMDGPMGNVSASSADEKQPDDPVGKIFGQVVNALAAVELTFVMTPTGEIKDVQVPEGALKQLKGLPGVDQFAGEMLTPEGMKKMMIGNVGLPDEAVKKGSTWTRKVDAKTPLGKSVGTMKYTYEGTVEKDGQKLEKIAVQPELTIEPDANAPVKVDLKKQEGKGYVYFNNQAGRLASSTNEQTMEMAIEVQNMTINQRVITNTSLRLQDTRVGDGSEKK